MTAPLILLTALLLDAVFGEPKWLWSRLPHPAVLMGSLVGWLDATFNRGDKRRAKGVLCLAVLFTAGLCIGAVISLLGPVAEILCAAILLAQRSLVEHVGAVATGLRQSIKAGRKAVALIVSRDTAAMDDSQVVRAAIESGAENLSDGVIAPAFWFLIAGAPGLVAYKCINTADSMIGYRSVKYADFGWATARMDDLLNLIPARLTAALIALVGRTFDLKGTNDDARLHRSPNAGWPEAAMARALGIALSGPRAYDGELRDFPWVNEAGRKDLDPMDIDASIGILWAAWAALFILCALLGFILA